MANTIRLRNYAEVIQSCLPSDQPMWFQPTLIRLVFAHCRQFYGRGSEKSTHSSAPELRSPFLWKDTSTHVTWLNESRNPAGHTTSLCYLSKTELCQIQYQKPLRLMLLTDVSTHKDNTFVLPDLGLLNLHGTRVLSEQSPRLPVVSAGWAFRSS